MAARSVRRRKVFYIAGYDPGVAAEFYRRFLRQLEIFKRTWGVQSACTDRSVSRQSSTWAVTTTGRGWSVETEFELLSWDDLIAAAADKSALVRFGRSIAVYVNLLSSGTLRRYFHASPRYFLFAIAPLFQVAALLILSFGVGFGVSSIAPEPWFVIGGLGATLVCFMILQRWVGRRWRLHQALDDWVLSLDYIHQRSEDVTTRIAHFADLISNAATHSSADEILVVGHSLGATFAADALRQALDTKDREIAFATVGATIPKCTLHPYASWLREKLINLAQTPTVCWVEIQTRADPISFFRVHPVSLEKMTADDQLRGGNPVIRRARLQEMLGQTTYKRIRWRPLRLHYQCVSANERKAAYDFFMMICGPAPVALWSRTEQGLMNVDGEFGTTTCPVR
jgi:pimeloyl-ACP methyl ester carboxylesterase